MKHETNQQRVDDRNNQNEKDNEWVYHWTPEQMLEMIMNDQETVENDWLEKGRPRLVNEILENYEVYEGINHLEGKDLPSNQVVIDVLDDLVTILFPGYLGKTKVIKPNTKSFLSDSLHSIYCRLVVEVEKSLKYICRRIEKCPEDVCLRRAQVVVKELLERIPTIRILLRGDIQAAYNGDPAAKSVDEVILSYPYVYAITTYRVAHELYLRWIPLIPRIMSEDAHSKTGIDIHPGAKIGRNFFIDHGTGVVIGETVEIGDNVKIYQGVTLGALSFQKDEKGKIIKGAKRHPTVGHNVVIYSGATVLGGETMIGDDAIVGGNVWITSSIAPNTQVTHVPSELRYKDLDPPKHPDQKLNKEGFL